MNFLSSFSALQGTKMTDKIIEILRKLRKSSSDASFLTVASHVLLNHLAEMSVSENPISPFSLSSVFIMVRSAKRTQKCNQIHSLLEIFFIFSDNLLLVLSVEKSYR